MNSHDDYDFEHVRQLHPRPPAALMRNRMDDRPPLNGHDGPDACDHDEDPDEEEARIERFLRDEGRDRRPSTIAREHGLQSRVLGDEERHERAQRYYGCPGGREKVALLKEHVVEAMVQQGILPRIKAELRSKVFEMMSCRPPTAKDERSEELVDGIKRLKESPHGLAVCNLVASFLEHYGMKETLNVFKHEAMLYADCPISAQDDGRFPDDIVSRSYIVPSKDQLCESLPLPPSLSRASTDNPLLQDIVNYTLDRRNAVDDGLNELLAGAAGEGARVDMRNGLNHRSEDAGQDSDIHFEVTPPGQTPMTNSQLPSPLQHSYDNRPILSPVPPSKPLPERDIRLSGLAGAYAVGDSLELSASFDDTIAGKMREIARAAAAGGGQGIEESTVVGSMAARDVHDLPDPRHTRLPPLDMKKTQSLTQAEDAAGPSAGLDDEDDETGGQEGGTDHKASHDGDASIGADEMSADGFRASEGLSDTVGSTTTATINTNTREQDATHGASKPTSIFGYHRRAWPPSLTTSSHDKKATQDLNLDGPVGGKTAGGPFATVTGAAAARASSLDDEIEEEIEADGEYDDEEFEPSDDGQIITRDDQPTDEGGRQADFDPTAAPPSHDQHTQDNDQPTAAASLPDRAAGPGQDGQPADGEDAAPSSDEDFGIITSGCDIEAESADFDAMVDEGEDVIDLDGRTAMTE